MKVINQPHNFLLEHVGICIYNKTYPKLKYIYIRARYLLDDRLQIDIPRHSTVGAICVVKNVAFLISDFLLKEGEY